MNRNKPVALVILDGFGYRNDPRYNAIQHARTPHLDFLFATYPHTLLKASGTAVGLLPGFMGNSEVGHLTIGSGRVIPQPITRLHEAITNGSFFENPQLVQALATIKEKNSTLHIMGLLSDGGVHSYDEDLFAFLRAAQNAGLKKVIVHPFLDGRDTPPQSAGIYLEKLEHVLKELGIGMIGSLHGRWFAMDRDHNWERTAACYNILTTPKTASLENFKISNSPFPTKSEVTSPTTSLDFALSAKEVKNEFYSPIFTSWRAALDHYYHENITDEFIPPTSLGAPGIKDGDGIIFFNYRPDRARQLTQLFLDASVRDTINASRHTKFNKDLHEMINTSVSEKINLNELEKNATNLLSDSVIKSPQLCVFLTPVSYGLSSNTPATNLSQVWMLDPIPVPNTLKEVLVAHDKTIFTIAESEKYAHVTYFFCGGKEEALSNEIRLLIPSIPVKTYIDHPAMSAPLITDSIVKSLEKRPKDFYLINYANADMVGHSGNFGATVKAVECLDEQIAQLYTAVVEKQGGTLLITADHGNAELMADPETGAPLTAHTTNPVPFIQISPETYHKAVPLDLKELADIAPYILTLMKLPIPSEMVKRTQP
jgi:2,3-bisphosphoglycerate-independent phosphoglycerate mutase